MQLSQRFFDDAFLVHSVGASHGYDNWASVEFKLNVATMLVFLPEILIAIINTLSSDSQFGDYTQEVKNALQSLALVNHAFYKWSSSHLYSRVTVTNKQISQLVATLQTTHYTQFLAKRIHSLRLVINDTAGWLRDDDDDLTNAISLLCILAPTLAFQRPLMDMDIHTIYSRTSRDLESAISCLVLLSELTLLNQKYQDTHFFWDSKLVEHKYDCLLELQVLMVGDVTIND
ncbi:hypothetical protein FRB95_002003 [Tulasnella sp. JGI-2019a]|nr:hypothetical protein FRB95_002003 [Tulasnella sp. JGI-2019a]